jgi:S1-C subfamily serine protease
MHRLLFIAVLLVFLAAPVFAAGAPSAQTSLDEMRVLERALEQAARQVAPSVVSVVVDRSPGPGKSAREVRMRNGRLEVKNGPNWEPAKGTGTGLVIAADGYVLTSTFFTGGDVKRVLVVMPDGAAYAAQVLGRDEGREIVLLKVEAEGLPVPDFAKPDDVRVGQWVVALGRTYGELDPSVNVGIVSAIGRIAGRAVQTDAAISPINYGGPLVDLDGRVVGLCGPLTATPMMQGTAFYDSGIGFAVPVTDLAPVLPRLVKGEVLKPGFLGIQFSTDRVDPGAAVRAVLPDTAAARAGLKNDDVITEADGRTVRNAFDLQNQIGRKYAGEKLALKVQRGADSLDVEVTLGERPVPRPATLPTTRATRPATRAARIPGARRPQEGAMSGALPVSFGFFT